MYHKKYAIKNVYVMSSNDFSCFVSHFEPPDDKIEIIEKKKYPNLTLNTNDKVEIVQFIGGG